MKGRRDKRRPRGVGRPRSQSQGQVRSALIAAAKRLFVKDGFENVTARQIAEAAGTTPAMIHYYFGNKIGLFQTMVQEAIEPFARMLGETGDAASAATDLAALIDAHLRTAAANPWAADLIVNEVLPANGKLRAVFVRDIASRLLPRLAEIIEQGKRVGTLREDIDVKLTALSILSLNAFPLISRSITAPILGFKLEGAELERLIAHTTSLVLRGIAAAKEPKP